MNRFSHAIARLHALRNLLYATLGTAGLTLLGLAPAEAGNMMTVNIMGSVYSGPACVINGNTAGRIEVHFGDDLRIDMIDGVNYKKPIPFSLTCTGSPTSLTFKFAGNPGSSFDPNVLSTNFTDLGVRLLKPDSSPLNLNEEFSLGYSASAPIFMAVPVQRTGATLPTGGFGTVATLTMEVI